MLFGNIARQTPAAVVFGTLCLFAQIVAPAGATTYYAAPELADSPGAVVGDHGNDGLSPDRPFLISDFWTRSPQAGDVLVLLDGTYTGLDSRIFPPPTLDLVGTPDNPIRIVAENDGRAVINGDTDGDGVGDLLTCLISTFNGDPADADGDGQWDRLSAKRYVSIEGLNVCNSSGSCVVLSGADHVRVYRVCAWNANVAENSMVFVSTYGDDNLFEDCAGWGTGRKIFKAYGYSAPGVESHGNTFRRCFGRWEKSTRSDPKMTFSYQYLSSHNLLENCVGTWDEQPGANSSQMNGIFAHDNGVVGMSRLVGCVAYLKASQNCNLRQLLRATLTSDFEIENCFAYVDNAHPRAPLINPFYVAGDGGANTVAHITSIGGRGVLSSRTYTSLQNVLVCQALDRDADGNPQDDNNVCALTGGTNATHVYFHANDENWESRNCLTIPLNILSPEVVPQYDPECPNRVDDRFRTGPDGIGLDPLLNVYGRSFLTAHASPQLAARGTAGSDVGADIWFRCVDGVQTREPLWPWPMNRRILDAMTSYHSEDPATRPPPIDVTRDVFELNGGSLPGDYDGDGQADLNDFAYFQACYSGPGGAPPPNCQSFDFDRDADIDVADFAYFAHIFGSY